MINVCITTIFSCANLYRTHSQSAKLAEKKSNGAIANKDDTNALNSCRLGLSKNYMKRPAKDNYPTYTTHQCMVRNHLTPEVCFINPANDTLVQLSMF